MTKTSTAPNCSSAEAARSPPDRMATGRRAGVGTVEEITRSDTVERGLLLDFGPVVVPALPPGTAIWLAKIELPVSA